MITVSRKLLRQLIVELLSEERSDVPMEFHIRDAEYLIEDLITNMIKVTQTYTNDEWNLPELARIQKVLEDCLEIIDRAKGPEGSEKYVEIIKASLAVAQICSEGLITNG